MKKTLIVALMMIAGIAQAGHPRCAGSYEPAKCEALEAKLAAETPEQRKASAQKLDASRQASMKEAHSLPSSYNGTQYTSNSTQKSIKEEFPLAHSGDKFRVINGVTMNCSALDRIRAQGYTNFPTTRQCLTAY